MKIWVFPISENRNLDFNNNPYNNCDSKQIVF